MRSTLTINGKTDAALRKLAEREHLTYKEVVNLALEKGLERLTAAEAPPAYQVRTFEAGLRTGIDPDKLNQILDDPDFAP